MQILGVPIMPKFYKSNPGINLPEDKDIIHDPNIQFFKNNDQPSHVIEKFLDDKERKILLDFFLNEYENNGENVNNKILRINHPSDYQLIQEIVHDKLKTQLDEDFTFYSQVSSDPISVGDQFFKILTPYQLHTDCITHIPGYKPYKDVVIPIELSDDKALFYYTCEQRYKSRATLFQKGRKNKYFAVYSNILREKPYEQYGVENCKYDAMDLDWFDKHVGKKDYATSYEGISIEETFPWIPGNAIVQDSCVIHGSSNYNMDNVSWKIGLTFHLLIKDPTYGKEIDGEYYTKFSRYTESLLEKNKG